MSKYSPLFDLAVLYTFNAFPNLTDSARSDVQSLIIQYLNGSLTYPVISSIYRSKFNTSAPIDRIREILEVPETPLPSRLNFPDYLSRHKTKQWTSVEDTRLLAGIHKYGTDKWQLVARYVGNNRTRSQCSQRWLRCLDPRISRSRWTAEDEAKLLKLVAEHGDKAWLRVSAAFGNRSDVQCRYRYLQIQKGVTAISEEDQEDKMDVLKEENMNDCEPVERIGLELGAVSMSDIFWLLHS
jgi:hypothetical protein